MTPEELPAYLKRLAAKAGKEGPPRAARAMANAYLREVVSTLGGPSPSAPGTPPGRRTGTLARSIRAEDPVMTGDYSAESSVAPHTVYARIQQRGGVIYPRHMTGAGRLDPYGSELSGLRTLAALGRRGAEARLKEAGKLGFLSWAGPDGRRHYSKRVRLPARPYMVMTPAARTACHDAAARAVDRLLG